MSKRLPSKPSLRHLQLQAKKLLKVLQSGEFDVCSRIEASHPRFSGFSESDILASNFTLSDAQLVIAREYGFTSWPKLKRHIERMRLIDHHPREIVSIVRKKLSESDKTIRKNLSEPEKVAVMLIGVEQEIRAKIQAQLKDTEVKQITQAINALEVVTTEQEDEILSEFAQLIMTEESVSGPDKER